MEILDIFFKIAAIIIAIVNIILTYYVFSKDRKITESDKEKARKISWLKTLVLDHNLQHFYNIIEKVENNLESLKVDSININEKQNIISNNDDLFISMRRKFIDTLLAIDINLYRSILKKMDDLQEEINTNTFNDGIKLSHQPMYNQKILTPITNAKTEVLKHLFQYKG